VSRALALALGVVLFHRLLAGSEADLGMLAAPGAAALLLLAIGAGLLARNRGPYLSDGVALALLLPLRGPIVDLVQALLPAGATADVVAGLLSLGPVGLALGRQLRAVTDAAPVTLLLGACAGEVLVMLGAGGWLPVWLAGPVCAAALAALAELGATRDGRNPAPPDGRWHGSAVLLGAALGLLLISLIRVVPAYATPAPHLAVDAVLMLLLPAALVALPASLLATEVWPRRLLGAAGGVLLALAVVRTLGHFDVYENAQAQVHLSWKLHARALDVAAVLPSGLARALSGGGAHLDAWAWLAVFAGLPAAALGVLLGTWRSRDLGWLAVGGAAAAAAPYALLVWPDQAPAFLLLLAGALAALGVPLALFGWRGLLLLPVGVLPYLDLGGDDPLAWRELPGLLEVRRAGEFTLDAAVRTLPADVALFRAPGRDVGSLDGRRARADAFTGRVPAFRLGPGGEPEATFEVHTEHAFGVEEPAPDPEAVLAPRYSFGLRVGGVPLHAGHPPLGPEGSIGRMTRLFAREGVAFVTGLGAELVAADLHDAARASVMVVSSPVPLGRPTLQALLDACGSGGWQAAEVREPVPAARTAPAGGFATVVVVPAPADLPGVSSLVTEEHLQRLASLLEPGGRCLVWLDTSWLPEGALAARLAAFGAVFGEQSAAFVEPRELDAPFVLLVGWLDSMGAPTAPELRGQLPGSDVTGARVRLSTPDDLAALLVRDGRGLARLASDAAPYGRSRPVRGLACATGGWASVAPLFDPEAQLSRAIAGAGDGALASPDLLSGLVAHTRYDYRLEDLNETLLEIRPDIAWHEWELEAGCYEAAARLQPGHPLLHFALAALLEPLAVSGDYGRFAQLFEAADGAHLPSWRLALQEWWVQSRSLEAQAAQAAAERAARLSSPQAGP